MTRVYNQQVRSYSCLPSTHADEARLSCILLSPLLSCLALNTQCILLHQDTSSTYAAISQAIIQMRDPTTGAALHAIVLVDPNTGTYKRVQGGIGGIDQDLNTKGKSSDAINLGVRKEDAVLNGIGLGLFGVNGLSIMKKVRRG